MMTTNEDTASIQHYVQGEAGTIQHYYSSEHKRTSGVALASDISEVMGITGSLAKIETGISEENPFHSVHLVGSADDDSEATIEAKIVGDGTSSIRIVADSVDVNGRGECVTLSGNAGQITLSTSAANYLTGRSAIWGESSNYDKVYDISLNPAVIKVKQAGMYLVKIAAYFTTGFTVNDMIHVNIEKQPSGSSSWTVMGLAAFLERVNNASYYRQSSSMGYMPLNEGDSIRMTAYNQTAARGQIYVNGYTNLQIIKVY